MAHMDNPLRTDSNRFDMLQLNLYVDSFVVLYDEEQILLSVDYKSTLF